jgi:hypothetical protein
MSVPRKKHARWSRLKRQIFLDHLAATCNVSASSVAAGMSPKAAYSLRRKDPAFVQAWEEAVLEGYALLETALAAHALGGGGTDRRIQTAGGELHVDDALRILTMHRNSMAGKWRGGRKLTVATREETDKAILEKLAAMEKADRGGEA